MGNERLIEAGKELSRKLDGLDFAFIGSFNLFLQGLDIKPRDIDVLTTPEEIMKIDSVLEEHRKEEICFDESEGRNSFRGFYDINGVEIEILGNVLNACREREELDEKVFIKKNGNVFPCVSLKNELYAYSKMNKQEKAEMIRKFMENKI